MKILIIGGTVFLGRHIVDYALAEGHEITLFNRGKHNPELFPEVKKIHGDRNTDYDKLKGQSWDAVIDTCGYVPGAVEKTANVLKGAAGKYIFVSSISAYRDMEKAGIDESYPLAELPEGASKEEMTMETYGPLKALCEKVVKETYSDSYVNVRAGLIVGPYDPTDRFTYWVNRIASGGKILCPGDGKTPVQFIDVRDLAGWIVKMVLNGKAGDYNATGPDYKLNMKHFLETCKKVCNTGAELVWVDEEFLEENGVKPWADMPAWAPDTEKEFYGLAKININKALKEDLYFMPLEETVEDTLNWDSSRSPDYKLKAGLSSEREQELLKIFKKL